MDDFTSKASKNLSADSLFHLVRSGFREIPDSRSNPVIPLGDALMSGFAMFSLKDPSLLAFEDRCQDPNDNNNVRSIYGIQSVPSDTQMRTILDSVDPLLLRPLFGDIFRRLQRGKALEAFVYHEGHYLLSLDGTGYFSSNKIHCSSCLEKHHRGGEITYSHQMLGASLVHPDLKEVIPLAPEPIICQDGNEKNDCKRNATRRWLQQFRRDHPQLPIIIIEDGLSSNAPHLEDLRAARARYIIGVKPGDHASLFQLLNEAVAAGQAQTLTRVDPVTGIQHHFRFHNGIPLNKSHPDCLVNILEYRETHPTRIVKKVERIGKVQHFSWITDFVLTPDNVHTIMRGGRSRWKIENETFNTLKNQGYNLEHNYGHGKRNLSVVLMMLMMLAFLVDQTQQQCCPLFQDAWKKKRNKKRLLWEIMRSLFLVFQFDSMEDLYKVIVKGLPIQKLVWKDSS